MIRGRGQLLSDERGSTLALPPGLEVLERRPDLVIASRGCVMFRLWRATATLESLPLCESALERFSAEHARYGTLTVVERDLAPPSADVRQAAGRMMARFMEQSTNALVIEGTGFKPMAMRLAITTIHLLAPSSTPPLPFGDVKEASEWLASQFPDVNAVLLTRDVEILRAL